MAEKPLLSIDGYTLIRQIGSGGMATVYEARDDKLHRTVAIKVLHPHYCTDQTAVERFKREALAAARIDHPNIVRVYDFRTEKRLPCIVLEYVPGTDLEKVLIKHGALDYITAVGVMYAIAGALAEAHEHDILHRDIKPANILLHQRGRVMLSDFGIARALNDERLTTPDSVAGTPAFMSPEQICGSPVGPQSDIYSWAVTFYFLMSGRLPYGRQTFPDVLHEVQHARIVLDETVMEKMAPALSELLRRCLSAQPQKRVQDGMLLRELLDGAHVNQLPQSRLRQLAAGLGPLVADTDDQTTATHTRVLKRKKIPSTKALSWIVAGFLVAVAAGLWLNAFVDPADHSIVDTSEPLPLLQDTVSSVAEQAVDTLSLPQDQVSGGAPTQKVPAAPGTSNPGALDSTTYANEESSQVVKMDRVQRVVTLAPQAQKAVPDSGELFIYCTPWARLFINGNEWGKTPMEAPLRLPAGVHTIKLHNEFCIELDTTVTVVADSLTRYRFALTVKPAYQR